MSQKEKRASHGRPSQDQGRPRREPLHDNYYYEEPPRRGRDPSGYGRDFEDISSTSSSSRRHSPPSQRTGKRKKKGRRTGLAVFCVFLVLVGFGAWYIFGYLLNGLTIKGIDKDKLGISGDVLSDGSIKNIALFGLDARENTDEGRSDALMILTVDNKHKKLKLTSILRDSEVSIEGYGQDKITHAYAYGGAELAIRTINQNFHLDIEDYVTVNFIQMAEIVDAFGGTRVNISYDEAMEINKNLDMLAQESADANIQESDFIYDEGDVLLNGNQAVAYAMIRYLDGDDVRASRQQNVLKGLITQLKQLNKLQYPELIRKVVPMCETSLDFGDIMGLAPVMLSDFTTETLSIPSGEEAPEDGYTDEGAWVYVYDLEAASQHISRFLYEEDSPYYRQPEDSIGEE